MCLLRRFKNRKIVSTELSWEERNPTNYIYKPSRAMKQLRDEKRKRESVEFRREPMKSSLNRQDADRISRGNMKGRN